MTQASAIILQQTSFSNIKGWVDDNHSAALAAFERSYNEMKNTAHGFKREALFGGTLADWLALPDPASS